MPFQTSVMGEIRSGLIGEVAFDGPTRVLTAVASTEGGANVIGHAYTYNDQAVESVQAGGTGVFAGIAINPKTHANRGVAGDTLGQSLTVPNGVTLECMFMGEVYVSLASDGGAIGDTIVYNTETGALDHGAAGDGTALVPNAVISRHIPSPTADGAFLAVIRLTN